MRTFPLILLAALVGVLAMAPPALAQFQKGQAVTLYAGYGDLNLETERGLDRLSQRLLTRAYAICGSPHSYMLTHVTTGGGKTERAACKAQLRIPASSPAGVKAAFALALQRFRY